jgi:hypothetical protein
MSIGRLVGMEGKTTSKPLKSLERVKGIEPSSSAWKACDKANEINGGLDFWRPRIGSYGPKV